MYLVEARSFPYPYPLELFISFQTLYPKFFLVADCSGTIAGYVVGVKEMGSTGHIISLAVHPSYRGRGLGSVLLKELEERMVRDGVKRIKLEVSVSNRAAISLYRSRGYRVVNVVPSYYPDGSDAYVMVKELRS